MGVTRVQARDYLGGVLAQQLPEAGLTAADDTANLGPVIDRALLTLGVDVDSLATAEVANDDAAAYYAYLDYFGLGRVLNAVLSHVDIQSGDPNMSKRKSQYVAALQQRLATLKEEAVAHGMTAGPGWQPAVEINLDFIEPEPVR
jgi:hypothetical protein